MDKYQRLGKNTFLVFLGNAGSRLIGLLMLPFYTRWLSPEDYGTVDVIKTYALLIMGFVAWCIADAIFVVPKNGSEDEKKSYFSSGLFFSFVAFSTAAILCVILNVVFSHFQVENTFSKNIWLIYLVMLGTFVQQYTQQFTRCIDKMGVYSITGIIHTLFLAVFSFVFIPKQGVIGYISAYVIAYLLSSVYSFVFSKSYKYVSVKSISRERLKDLLKYSIPLLPNSIMWWLVTGLNRPVIESNIGMEGNGILAVAQRIPAIIGMLYTIFNNAWLISMMEEFGKPGFVKFFSTAMRCVMFPSILCSILLSIFMKPLIAVFVDASFIDAYKYAPIAIMAILLSNMSGLLGGIFAARKQSKYFFYSSIWAAATSVVSMFVLIPMFGLYGATIATCISYIASIISRYIYTKKDLEGCEFKPVIISLLLFAVVTVLVPLQITVYIKILFYVFIIIAVFLVNKDILRILMTKMSIKTMITSLFHRK